MQVLELSEATAARRRIPILMVDATDGYTAETGLTLTVTVSKNGAAFGASGGSVTEVSSGVYYYEATAGELDTVGYLNLKATGTGARDFMALCQVVAYDPYTAFITAASIWATTSETGETFGDAIRLIVAMLVGAATIQDGNGAFAFRDKADTKDRVAGTKSGTARAVTTRDGT